ncbi:uncharacterized protein JCM15063_002958 [Sporobolomyces koalae]|uniref:uncharacterized protein n=1 Tax=Sporobolomyces koalae TaxID=500713 RepID=UPI003176A589
MAAPHPPSSTDTRGEATSNHQLAAECTDANGTTSTPLHSDLTSNRSKLPPSFGDSTASRPELAPLSIPSNPGPTSLPTARTPELPKLKTHPADLVSSDHPDPHALASPTPSIPYSPVRNSYEDLPSATAERGHGFSSYVDHLPEHNGTLVEVPQHEDDEEDRHTYGSQDRRESLGVESENGATVGSHSVHHGQRLNGDEPEPINGLEVVGEEPLAVHSTPPPAPPPCLSKDLPNEGPLPRVPESSANYYTTPPSSRRFVPPASGASHHSRSLSTPPQMMSSFQSAPPPPAALFSPASPPAMSPPSALNSIDMPSTSSQPPSRRTSTSQRAAIPPPTSSYDQPHQRSVSTSTSSRAARRDREGGAGDEKERLTDSAVHQASATTAAAAGTTSSSSSRSRRVLGEWQMTKTLGAGSMGKVKLGVSSISGDKVAIKIIPRFTSTAAAHRPTQPALAPPSTGSSAPPESTTSSSRRHSMTSTSAHNPLPPPPATTAPEPTASFLAKAAAKDQSKEIRTVREGSLSLLLHHPYVCGMREMMIYPQHYYFVQEYVNGGQMLDYIISHGRLRERSARKFARQIGSALEYCHANSIVHRDLKIENILISKTGNIKIIDFGLSNLYSPLSHLSTFCGSLYFAAPELLNAKPYVGPEVDVWSFGIVLYVLVCGKVPFDDQSMPALHAKIKRGQVDYPNWLSAECKHLLSRMLVTVPSQRATLQEVLAHPWIVKGFTGAPAAHIPARTPLRLGELDADVLRGMTGFEFGSIEEIESNLTQVLNSEPYKLSVRNWEIKKAREAGGPLYGNGGSGANGSARGDGSGGGDPEKERPSMRVDGKDIKRSPTNKRFSGLGFYGKKLAGGFNLAFAGANALPKAGYDDLADNSGSGFFGSLASNGGQPKPEQLDPTRGFHPLISIYYLVKEKIERERIWGPGVFASSTVSLTGPPPPPAPAQAYQAGSAITSPALVASPDLVRPPAASPLIPMTPQPRQRATGEEFAPHPSTAPQMPRTTISAAARHSTVPSSSAPGSPVLAGFRPQSSYEPPTSPSPRERASKVPAQQRMSLIGTLDSSTQSPDDIPLSSSISAASTGGFAKRFGSLLGRSSPEGGKGHRNRASIGGMAGHRASNKTAASPLPQVSEAVTTTSSNLRPPVTRLPSSGSDVPLASPPNGKPVARASTVGEISPSRHQRGVSMGATTLMRPDAGESSSVGRSGAGFFERRRQSSIIQTPPPRPNTTNDIAGMFDDVAEEELVDSAYQGDPSSTSKMTKPNAAEGTLAGGQAAADVGFIGRTPSQSSSGKDTSESAKPVWLKGLFSVSTTTTKPVATLRADLIKVLDRLGVQHRDVKNGFECVHVPSIDMTRFGGGAGNSAANKDKTVRTTIKRRASKLLLQKKDGELQSQDEGASAGGGMDDSQSSLRIATDPASAVAARARTQSSGSFTPISPVDHSPPLTTGSARFENGHHDGAGPAPGVEAASNPSAVSNDMIVRFEIFIVKMPLLPGFHGIQFRRISGSAYLTLVKRILQELKL